MSDSDDVPRYCSRPYHQMGEKVIDHFAVENLIALWGLKERARMKREDISFPPSCAESLPHFSPFQGMMIEDAVDVFKKALIDGNYKLIHKVAEAMKLMEEDGWTVGENGNIQYPDPDTAQRYMVRNWQRWESGNVIVKERLDEMSKNGFKITRETYYRIARNIMPL
jgi:hypothetical protein